MDIVFTNLESQLQKVSTTNVKKAIGYGHIEWIQKVHPLSCSKYIAIVYTKCKCHYNVNILL